MHPDWQRNTTLWLQIVVEPLVLDFSYIFTSLWSVSCTIFFPITLVRYQDDILARHLTPCLHFQEQGGANNNATPQVSAQPKPLITPEGKDDDHPQIERTQDADAGENKDISDIVRKIDMEKEVSEQPVAVSFCYFLISLIFR